MVLRADRIVGVVSVFYFALLTHRAFTLTGLTPETAFGCALDFLFRPRPEIMELIKPGIQEFKNSRALTIGVHIRVGDHVLHGKDNTNVHAPNILNFDCAKQIEEYNSMFSTNNAVWLLVSDSEVLRQHAKKMYGRKVITRLHRKIEHSFGHQYTNTRAQASLEGFLEAVGERSGYLASQTCM